MKKLLLTCALVGAVTAAFGQGSVYFSNGTITRLSLDNGTTKVQIPLTASINFGLFYGIGQSTSLTFLDTLIGWNSTSSAGIIANPADRKSAMTAVQIPGSTPGEADIWLQVKGWDHSFGSDWLRASQEGVWFGQSVVRNVGALGPATGPGVQIWQGSAGTVVSQLNAFALTQVPEPTMMALAGLGLASLLIFRRRK